MFTALCNIDGSILERVLYTDIVSRIFFSLFVRSLVVVGSFVKRSFTIHIHIVYSEQMRAVCLVVELYYMKRMNEQFQQSCCSISKKAASAHNHLLPVALCIS